MFLERERFWNQTFTTINIKNISVTYVCISEEGKESSVNAENPTC